MANTRSGMHGPRGGLLRPAFEEGGQLSAHDLHAEQSQRWQKLRRHNRYLHGTGVVCGLRVVAAGRATRPWSVWVCPGYAVGPFGDEIVVTERLTLDLAATLWKRAPAAKRRVAHVGICSAQEDRRPRPGPTHDRGPGEYVSSRRADAFEVDVFWNIQPAPSPQVDLCRHVTQPCPRCPQGRYLILAAVRLPPEGSLIEDRHIRLWQ